MLDFVVEAIVKEVGLDQGVSRAAHGVALKKRILRQTNDLRKVYTSVGAIAAGFERSNGTGINELKF